MVGDVARLAGGAVGSPEGRSGPARADSGSAPALGGLSPKTGPSSLSYSSDQARMVRSITLTTVGLGMLARSAAAWDCQLSLGNDHFNLESVRPPSAYSSPAQSDADSFTSSPCSSTRFTRLTAQSRHRRPIPK